MEDFKYYTLFGVRLRRGPYMTPIYTGDFILRWTTHEKKACKIAKDMIDNKLWKTSTEDAININGLNDESSAIFAIGLRLKANPEISAHLVETDFLLEDEWVDILIDAANAGNFGKQQLAESKIRL